MRGDISTPNARTKRGAATVQSGALTSHPVWPSIWNSFAAICVSRTEHWSFGGRDNLFSRETTDEPSPQQKRDLMAAITTGVKAILQIDRHDRQTDADSAVDQFLQRLKAGAE